jgi:hypothetical protein
MRQRYDLVPGSLSPTILAEAESLLPDHLPRVA